MATLTAGQRKKLKSSQFGLPGRLAYPMPDASHAANAKARATQQVGESITAAQKAQIDRKANAVLHRGGK